MITLSIAIQKGGSGKTTTAINLAAGLRHLGKSVLLLDLDPQANMTQALGFEDPQPNLYDLLRQEFDGEEAGIDKAIVFSGDLPLIPASLDLAGIELELVSVYNREKVLRTMLQPLENKYDFLVIDCPPAINLLTVNALNASDYVLMPLQAEFLPLRGVHSFMKTFQKVRKQLNPELKILGFVLTRYDSRKSMNRNILDQLNAEFGSLVFETNIRTNISLAQAQEWGQDIFRFDNTSNGAFDYMQLAQEVLLRLNK
ncbi:MAG: ParA family protein [Bacteroidia bacterium]|nr:ParA family protein [Bacteroidia bacterium]